MKTRLNPYLGTLLVIAMTQPTHAADITWDSLGADDNWSTFDNWSDDATPAGDDITFNIDGRASGITVTSIVDDDYAINSLRFTHDNTSNHTLSISDTRTLDVTGSFIPLSGQATAVLFSKANENNTATTNITGPGTFTVNNASNHFLVGFQANNANSSSRVEVDMSGLTNFSATVNIFGVGRKGTNDSTTVAVQRHESGSLVLAQSNNVTATAITVGDSTKIDGTTAPTINQGFVESTLFLSAGGGRVNNLNADTMIFGRGKASGAMQFATGAVPTDNVKLRGTVGGSAAVTDFILGDRNLSSSSGAPSGTVEFGAGKVDGLITNLYVGRWGTGAGSSKINPLGTFTMGSNADSVVTVTTAYLALGQSTTNPTTAQIVTGNLNVTGGVFSATTLNLATGATHANVTRVANVTVDGGTFRFADIISPTTGGTANLNFTSGTIASIDATSRTLDLAYNLGMTGGGTTVAFGQASDGTGTLALNGTGTLLGDTTLETVQDTTLGGAVGGAFSLTKSGPGALLLSGANTYSGNTIVSTGTLELTATTGSLTFAPGANTVSNKVTGAGTAAFNGTFNIDLTNAAVADNNSWVLADVASQTFDETSFSVAGGFMESPEGTWKLTAGANAWTFTQSDATLRLAVVPGYANWLTLHPTITDPAAGADPENDGIENVLEYVLNGNPMASDPAILPDLDASGANFIFSFTRREESPSDTTQVFQYGTNLSTWADVAITGTPGSEVTFGTPSEGLQTVTVTIPKSAAGPGGNLFGRLQAVKLP